MRIRWIALVFAVASCGAQADFEEIITIPLKHRLAAELADSVRGILDPGETVVPNGGQLIVKARPFKIAELRGLINSLDTPRYRLMVTVAQGRGLNRESLEAFAQTRAGMGDSPRIRGHVYQTETQSLGEQIQRIQTVDGQPAVIQFGEQVPLPTQNVWGAGLTGSVVAQSSEYRDITSGFEVTPRVSGETVTLDVAPWSSRMSRRGDGSIDTQSAHTTLQARIGEWVELGGQMDRGLRTQLGLGGAEYSTRSETNRIFLKVDKLGQ